MNDDIDIYLSRCLKSWAGLQKPAVLTRDQLLKKAVLPVEPVEGRSLLHSILKQHYPSQQHAYRPFNDWLLGPFTQSRTYLLHTATPFRVVA